MTDRLCACGHVQSAHLDNVGLCDGAQYCQCPRFALAPWTGRCASCDGALIDELAVCRGCMDEPIRVRHVVMAAVAVMALVMVALAC